MSFSFHWRHMELGVHGRGSGMGAMFSGMRIETDDDEDSAIIPYTSSPARNHGKTKSSRSHRVTGSRSRIRSTANSTDVKSCLNECRK
jgi:hypothetical protein